MSDPWSGDLRDPRRMHAPEPENVPKERQPLWYRWRRLLPTIIVAIALLLVLTSALHHGRVYGTAVPRLAPVHRKHTQRACKPGDRRCAAQKQTTR